MYFQTKNPYLGKFWRALKKKVVVYLMAIWYILRPFGIFFPIPYCTKTNLATLFQNQLPQDMGQQVGLAWSLFLCWN
jgi:hypothetical protein